MLKHTVSGQKRHGKRHPHNVTKNTLQKRKGKVARESRHGNDVTENDTEKRLKM